MQILPQNRIRLWLDFAVLSGFFAITFSIKAQAPEIIGPRDTNQVGTNEAFASGVWTTKASMPTPRDSFSISQVNGKIYVVGGQLFNNCTPINTLEEYNPATDAWTTKTPMPTNRWFAGAGTLNNQIMYVVGGQSACGGALPTVEAYDPASDTWTTKAPMPTARYDAGIGVVDGIIYAIGGKNSGLTPVSIVEAYDPGTNTWMAKASMGQARSHPVVAVVNDKIYAIGGFDVGYPPGSDQTVEEYDPATNTWTTKAPMPTARGEHPAGDVLNNIIYVAGGEDQENAQHQIEITLSTVEAYNPATNTWMAKPDMLSGRTGLGAAVVNNTLYAIGGFHIAIATVGRPFVYQVTATNDPISYDTICLQQCLPDGLSIDHTTGVIFGVPTTPGTSSFAVIAMNGSGPGPTPRVTLTVPTPSPPVSPAVSPPPMIVSNTSVTGRTNQPFYFQVLAKNASDAARFTAGGLPHHQNDVDELTIDPDTGLIHGTPTSDGYFSVALTVTDGSQKTHATLQLTFTSDPNIPILTSTTQPGGSNAVLVPGQNFSRTLTADVSNPVFTYIGIDGQEHGPGATCDGLPPGLCFDPQTARIFGIYNPTPTPSAVPGTDSVARSVAPFTPDTIKIRPLFAILPIAHNANGTGVAPLDFIEPTPTPSAVPSAPVARAATFVASSSFAATWNSVSGATGYRCDVSTSSSFTSYVPGYQNLNVGNVTTHSVTGLNASTTYYYRVRAYNGVGTSGNSNVITVRTLTASGAPVAITNPASLIASYSAVLNGSVDPHGLSTTIRFEYGTTTAYGSVTGLQTKTGNTYQNVSANVSGLSPNTTYHFRIVATNSAGVRHGSDRTFTTLSATGAPVVITNPASLIASYSAMLNGSLDPHGSSTSVYFEYGTTTMYGLMTVSQTKTGDTYQNVSANISGLNPNTTYHFRIVASNNAGTRYGSDRTFTTLSATGPPVVTTNPATNLSSSSATLNGSLDPHGLAATVFFRWGTTTSYGHTTPLQTQTGNTFRNIAANITGLSTHTTYHFRIVATNNAGTRLGSDRVFMTP